MKPLEGSASRRASASPDAVWRLVSDVTQMGRWSPECIGGEWLDGATEAVPGARFRGRNRMAFIRWSTVCTVVAAERGRLFSFEARHWSGATTRWTFEVDGHDDRDRFPSVSETVLRESYRTGESPAFILLLDRLFRRPRRLQAGMRTTLERLSEGADRDGRPA